MTQMDVGTPQHPNELTSKAIQMMSSGMQGGSSLTLELELDLRSAAC